jgi:autotransporter-associated beta strand protein
MKLRALGVAIVCLPLVAHAGTKTWTGTTNQTFSTAGNWSPAGAPATGDDLVFGPGFTVNDDLAAFSAHTITFNGASGGTTLQASSAANVITVTSGITASNTTSFDVITVALKLGGDQTWSMPIELDVNGPIDLSTYTLTFDVNNAVGWQQGVMSGTGNVVKSGNGTLEMTQMAANTFTGSTTINGGAIYLGHAAGATALPGAVTVANGAVLQNNNPEQIGDGSLVTMNGSWFMQSYGETIGALGGNGTISHTGLLVISGAATSTFAGDLTGTGGLTRAGTGTTIMTAGSTYSGTTTITGGELDVDGNVTATAFTVSGGVLGGGGAIGAVSLTAGTLSPGKAGTTSTLSTGNLDLGGTAKLLVQLDGGTAGTGYDVVHVVGTVTLSGILQVSRGFSPAVGDHFIIIDNDGADPVSGTFAGIPNGGAYTADNLTMDVSYDGGDGNDVVLTITAVGPPPDLAMPVDLADVADLAVAVDDLAAPMPDDLAVTTSDVDMSMAQGGSSGGCDMSRTREGVQLAGIVLLVALWIARRARSS